MTRSFLAACRLAACALAASALAACGNDASGPSAIEGVYTLHRLNEEPLPYDHEGLGCCTYLSGTLDLEAGSYAAALAVARPDWAARIATFLTAERDLAVTRATVDKAGAVDGVTAQREATVDGFGPEIHGPLIDELGRIARG